MNSEVIIRPWAKINLFLKILGKRSDGYHELFTFIHPLALFDEIKIKVKEGSDIKLSCKSEGLPADQDIPLSQDNLVAKVIELFFKNIERKVSVEVDIIKRIPIGGGMGGGSSDAANTINGLNKLFGNPLNKDIVQRISMSLGMDVASFLDPRPSLCKGRGEIIEKRFEPLSFWCVLINPGKVLSTKLVYNNFNLTLTEIKTADNISNLSNLAEGYTLDSLIDIGNDLEYTAIKLCPEIGQCLNMLRNAGAIKSIVCGSGCTVCGFFKTKSAAEEVMGQIRKEIPQKWWIKVVSSLF
jgi:4-diphosphocytidyl-2-C-methyl-D-erythritol kinase